MTILQGYALSDTLVYAFVAYLVAHIGLAIFVPKGERRRGIVVILVGLSTVFVIGLSILDFVSGMSTKDRLTAFAVCSFAPEIERCVEIRDSVPKYTKEDITERAISRLIGDPYGRTSDQVRSNITGVRFKPDGLCGSGKTWIVSGYVPSGFAGNTEPISGEIFFDERSEDGVCWSLPYIE